MRNIKNRTKEQKKEAYYTKPRSGQKDDIIEWLIHTDFVDNYTQKLHFKAKYKAQDLNDITQDIWTIILQIDQDRWNEIYTQGSTHIIQYISGLIYRQISSTSSQIYKRYKEYREHYATMTDTIWEIYEKTNKLPDEARQTKKD